MALQLYLIRHGRTEWNEKGLLQSWGDSPLTEQGISAAKRTGEALYNVAFSACYSSELKRAQDTANYIIHGREIPHFHHQGLNELNFGLWEGKAIAELQSHPEYQLLANQPRDYQAIESQGETVEQLYHRVHHAFWEIANRHQQDGQVLIVAHGLTLTLLTAILNGVEWYDFRNPEKHRFVSNTSINIVEVEHGKAKLLELNNRAHLD